MKKYVSMLAVLSLAALGCEPAPPAPSNTDTTPPVVTTPAETPVTPEAVPTETPPTETTETPAEPATEPAPPPADAAK